MTSSEERAARVAAIRERTTAATPGPWGWRGNLDAKQITLFRLRAWGDVVMDFCRWGFQEAMPQFVTDGIIRKPEWIMGPEHHPWEIAGINHPDAIFIAESRADLDFLLDQLAEADVERERLAIVERACDDLWEVWGDSLVSRRHFDAMEALGKAVADGRRERAWREQRQEGKHGH